MAHQAVRWAATFWPPTGAEHDAVAAVLGSAGLHGGTFVNTEHVRGTNHFLAEVHLLQGNGSADPDCVSRCASTETNPPADHGERVAGAAAPGRRRHGGGQSVCGADGSSGDQFGVYRGDYLAAYRRQVYRRMTRVGAVAVRA
eukprot:ctg_44.g12